MSGRNSTVLTSICLFAVLALPRAAAADQITVTSGFLQMTQSPQGQLSLVGERGFSLDARPIDTDGNYAPRICNLECGPGMNVSLAAEWAGSAVSGQLAFDGRTYTDLGGGESETQAIVLFGGSFVTPLLAPTAMLTAPFVFSGSFAIPTADGLGTIRHTLAGSGTATISLREWDSAFWNIDAVRYDFAQPAPVPEPATMLLVGFGTLLMASRRKHASTRKRGPRMNTE